jgi:hypothetical protein
MDARAALLQSALYGLTAETAEAGLAAAAPGRDPATAAAALATMVTEGLIHEPIRLMPGALHCHWRLELTPSGRDAARSLTGA